MPNTNNENEFRFSIRLTVVGVFAMATLITSVVAISLQYHFSRTTAIDTALMGYQSAAYDTRDFLNSLDESANQAAQILAKQPGLMIDGWISDDILPLFSEIMLHHRSFYAIYLGFANGNFYEVVNLNSSNTARRQLRASPEDRWLVITVKNQNGERIRQFDYYDDTFKHRITRSEVNDYDPRNRPWYISAEKGSVHKTAPYLFQHLQSSGQTYSTRLDDGSAVLAVDITHSSLSGHLRARNISKDGEVFLFQKGGELIASNMLELELDQRDFLKPLKLSTRLTEFVNTTGKFRVSNELNWPPIDYAVSGMPKGYSIELLQWIADMSGLEFEFVNGYTWPQLVALFNKGDLDILQPVFRDKAHDALSSKGAVSQGLWSKPFLNLPYAVITLPNHSPIELLSQLNHKTIALPKGWTIVETIHKHYPLIHVLPVDSPKEAVEAVINGLADATLDSSVILHHTAEYFFLQGIQFHEKVQFNQYQVPEDLYFKVNSKTPELVEVINLALGQLTDVQKHYLKQKWFYNEDENNHFANQFSVPYSELLDYAKQPKLFDELMAVSIQGEDKYAFITPLEKNEFGQEYFAVVISAKTLFAKVIESVATSIYVTVGILLLMLPVCWLFAAPIVRPIKRLAAESDKIRHRQYDDVKLVSSHISELDELSESMVNMAKSIQQHEMNQRQLMESLIQLIAQAIDDKSPYTAGHCERVPELAIMLAKAAEASNEVNFKEFSFKSGDEFTEFRIAAWLHDCGKITTPEHIIDKGSKLETNYNRIHEIRMRFEVLWRDAEIECLKQIMDRPDEADLVKAQLENKLSLLQGEFEFIAQLNQGSEFVKDEQLDRLEKISRHTWLRNFSDRLGLSPVENMRLSGQEAELPAVERLISDKPEHLIARHDQSDSYQSLGLNVDVPQHLYNLGEHYNLSVKKGTLTQEDRFKIQEHIISTIKMLESLPFPEELSRVPRYASTHHETLNGKGYPRKLFGHDLSIPERIMALADVFEALTASDRPYKKAKPISEAIFILEKMVNDSHIDRNVFDLFLSSGVYLDYANKFLAPEQIDKVDIKRYVSTAQISEI